MHHVPYTYKLHSGKTVIQYIYDSHYEGADAAAGYVDAWKPLEGRIDEQRYGEVLAQLEYQAGQAQVWRDAVTIWFLRASGIPDARGRVGHYPGRFEAESMALDGYAVSGCRAMGSRFRRKSRRMCRGAMCGHPAFRRRARLVYAPRPVFRFAYRRLPLSSAGGEPGCR